MTKTISVLIPNQYDPQRAHLAIYNGAHAAAMEVDGRPFLQPGDSFRLLSVKDFFREATPGGPMPRRQTARSYDRRVRGVCARENRLTAERVSRGGAT